MTVATREHVKKRLQEMASEIATARVLEYTTWDGTMVVLMGDRELIVDALRAQADRTVLEETT